MTENEKVDVMLKKLFHRWDLFLSCIILIPSVYCCVTSKSIPPSQLSKIPDWKDLYYFHAEDSTWIVKPVPSAGNQFSGVIFESDEIKKARQVHIYAFPLSEVKIEAGILSIPMANIVKVENFKISAGTVLIAAGVIVLLFLIPVYL